MDFDYYKDTANRKFGLVRTASLIHAARNEVKNSVLVDNGDLIQGSPHDIWRQKAQNGDIHPVYKALNTLITRGWKPGNHEFTGGLDYLHNALAGAKFPMLTPILSTLNPKPLFTPYLIKETNVIDKDGNPQTLKIGLYRLCPAANHDLG